MTLFLARLPRLWAVYFIGFWLVFIFGFYLFPYFACDEPPTNVNSLLLDTTVDKRQLCLMCRRHDQARRPASCFPLRAP